MICADVPGWLCRLRGCAAWCVFSEGFSEDGGGDGEADYCR